MCSPGKEGYCMQSVFRKAGLCYQSSIKSSGLGRFLQIVLKWICYTRRKEEKGLGMEFVTTFLFSVFFFAAAVVVVLLLLWDVLMFRLSGTDVVIVTSCNRMRDTSVDTILCINLSSMAYVASSVFPLIAPRRKKEKKGTRERQRERRIEPKLRWLLSVRALTFTIAAMMLISCI